MFFVGLRRHQPAVTRLSFDGCPNGPDETQQFAAHSGYGVLRAFSPSDETPVSRVQSMLGFPRDCDHVRVQCRVTFAKRGTHRGSVSIRPRGFDDDASEMRVARFRDRAPAGARPPAIFTRDPPTVAHQLPWSAKPPELAAFRH